MDIYQHFRKEEHPFIDQVLSWYNQVERSFQPKLTDFLDPREQQIIDMLVGKNNTDVKSDFFGGPEQAERKRAIIAPYYEQIDNDDFELCCLDGRYPTQFTTIAHSDVMGTFLSLGLRRSKLGDIYARDGYIQFMITKDISSYVMMNLKKIKNIGIHFKEIPYSQVIFTPESWSESHHTVSSVRLDVMMKAIYNLSRKEAASYISKGLVKLNYKVTEDTKTVLEEGDLISVRGKGRSKFIAMNGQSKKGKWKVTTGFLAK